MIEEQPSGKLYTVVTKYWPRIAAGLVIVIGLVEFVVGGLTADSGLEFYLLAWAATTGGLCSSSRRSRQRSLRAHANSLSTG